MAATKTDIWVYAHWKGMEAPKYIGDLHSQMHQVIKEVISVFKDWRPLASKLGIPRAKQEMMSPAFKLFAG